MKIVLVLIGTLLISILLTSCINPMNKAASLSNNLNQTVSQDNWPQDVEETEDGEETEEEYPIKEIQKEQLKEYYAFTSKTFQYMLGETQDRNVTYAPMNFYMTLSILSEMTEKGAQKELQDALGYADLKKHAEGLQNLMASLKEKRGQPSEEEIFGRLNLDTSFWLQDTLHYQETVMNTIQKQYGIEVFEGDFQNPEYQKQMTNWVYEKTNHSLQPQFEDLMSTSENSAFGIFSTLDFFGEWLTGTFQIEDTKNGLFYCNDGMQVDCEFMNFEKPYAPYLRGDDYISTELNFVTGEKMIFILPNEKQSIRDFWQGDRLTDILSAWEKDNFNVAKMKFSVPKFTCSGKIDLKKIAEKMQVNQLFDPYSDAFFSFSNETLYLSDIQQEAKIAIDEMGCSVASYTAVYGQSAAPEQEEEIDICLNRPFCYILCKNGIPYLIGIVNHPTE